MAATDIAAGRTVGNRAESGVAYGILLALSFSHVLNDSVQSLLLAIYPLLKQTFQLSFAQVGLITGTFQITASIFQPVIGAYTDKRPWPYALAIGMVFAFFGLLLMAQAPSFGYVLLASALVGLASAIYHPESSRVARAASGGKFGLAQSIFQVGGNTGQAFGPLIAAFVILPHGQYSISWFAVLPLVGALILWRIGSWYRRNGRVARTAGHKRAEAALRLSRGKIILALATLLCLIFSKYFYLAGLTSYFTFYLIDRFHVSTASAQMHLFAFLAAVAVGTLVGGPIGDRVGRRKVIWVSILGIFPFAFALPYANLMWTGVLSVIIGLIIASAFSAILIYAQELLPGKVGLVGGLFFGLGFGMAGIGAAVLGRVADATSIEYVYHLCSYLPLLGLLTAFLPDIEGKGYGTAVSPTPDSEVSGVGASVDASR